MLGAGSRLPGPARHPIDRFKPGVPARPGLVAKAGVGGLGRPVAPGLGRRVRFDVTAAPQVPGLRRFSRQQQSYLELREISAPVTPQADHLRFYAKDNGSGVTKAYIKDSAGTETELGAGGGAANYADLVTTVSLLALQVADNTNVALFLGSAGNRVADSFDALTYVDTAGATNLDSGTAGVLKPSTAGLDAFVTALLHVDGSNGSTTITDSALSSPPTWTATSGAALDTSQSKFGASSCLFDGSNDYVVGNGGAPFGFGTGDFAIDFWVRFNSLTGTQNLYDGRPGSNGAYPLIQKDVTTHFLSYIANGGTQITGTTALTTGAWHHVALTRTGTSTRLFLNGVQEGSTYSDSTNYANPVGSYPNIGRQYNNTTFLNGWLDEVRISKGAARWTTTFTPPTGAYSSSAANLTVRSSSFTAASAPTQMKMLIRVKEVDAAVAGTDYTLEVSRDGGTTWTAATLTELFTSPSPTASIRVVESNDVDVSGQPSGTSPRWRFKTLNNKMVELHDAYIFWV